MKKFLLLLACFLATVTGLKAQNDSIPPASVDNDTIGPWIKKGNASFLFNQSAFDNWLAGGENNYSGSAGINYDINYKKGIWSWDNKFIASYGLVKTNQTDYAKKTDDRLEINSIVGRQATERWYYSFFLNFKTQLTRGYNYFEDEVTGEEIREEYTDFMSPGYLYFGPGLMWKKDDNLRFNISPLASKMTFVQSSRTLPDEAYFGVKEGKSMRYELGANASFYYKLDVIANVNFENILNLYSNYLEDPQNVDIDYQLNVVMKINRYLTTNLSFQTIYDDNAFEGFQLREVFGLAVNYGF